MLETIILDKCSTFLKCEDYQFGFNKGHSTDLCIYTLKKVTNYYTRKGSPVFIAFLDIEKAFDKVNHTKLFRILIRPKIPVYIVEFLRYWYAQQKFRIITRILNQQRNQTRWFTFSLFVQCISRWSES